MSIAKARLILRLSKVVTLLLLPISRGKLRVILVTKVYYKYL